MEMHHTSGAPMVELRDYQRQYWHGVKYEAAPQISHKTGNTRTPYHTYEEDEVYQNSEPANTGVQETVPPNEHYTVSGLSMWQRFVRNGMSWTTLLLTLIFFLATITYARRPTFARKLRMVRSSSSHTIFVLRLLSQVADILLAISLNATFEKIQWHFIWPEGEGASFATVSALAPGTGVWGLLRIAFGKMGTRISARCWSIIRLLSIVVAFALGVLIMSDVRTELGFQIVAPSSEPRSSGYQDFNASKASLLAFSADQIFGMTLDQFLLDPRGVIDITPVDRGNQSCSMGYDINQGQVCARTLFLPVTDGAALDQTHPEADLVVVQDAVGYQLEFSALDEAFQFEEAHCHAYGTEAAAFELCLRSADVGRIAAKLSYCVMQNSYNSSCIYSTEWSAVPGWRTLMEATLRTADIAYNRRKDTIVAHSFTSVKKPAAVTAEDLLEAYNLLVDAETPGSASKTPSQNNTLDDIVNSILSGGDSDDISNTLAALITVNKLSVTIPSAFDVLTRNYPSSSHRAYKGSGILQNLLAIPLWYCSTSNSSTVDPSKSNPTSQLQPFIDSFRHGPSVYLAESEYKLVVGKWTVLAYAGIGGLAIVFCLVALILTTFSPRAARLPDFTPFPLFNFWRWCEVKGVTDPYADRWTKEQRVYCTRAEV